MEKVVFQVTFNTMGHDAVKGPCQMLIAKWFFPHDDGMVSLPVPLDADNLRPWVEKLLRLVAMVPKKRPGYAKDIEALTKEMRELVSGRVCADERKIVDNACIALGKLSNWLELLVEAHNNQVRE